MRILEGIGISDRMVTQAVGWVQSTKRAGASLVPCVIVVASLGCGSLGCGDSRLPVPEQASAAAESSQAVRPFVAFRRPTLILESLETAVVPPVAVGSTLRGDLLSSSDPQVVSIDASGNLTGHKNGTAIVRAYMGGTLQVIVNAIGVLQVVPGHLELVPGGMATVRIMGDGRELPTASYRWETTNPNTAMTSGSTVYAGYTSGTATLTVRSGN